MIKVEIYITNYCPYCLRAKALLKQKGVDYIEIRVDKELTKFEEMIKRSNGRRSVPQIFINDRGIGGFNDLWKLEGKKELDKLLISF
ncbi:glutaredoxin 3 [Coxiella endosymbiont of Rhipicephalus microplus]|uniref:glutaredoxin 3 n=1 Tax=Coxiella endosymbiont of Rhipicephalus microplus TaxID=1656186 RepID=UPI000C7FEC68|nr:glutaredoxin 3 [Coxiella endosymbiont of Rhipicephalus microplus]